VRGICLVALTAGLAAAQARSHYSMDGVAWAWESKLPHGAPERKLPGVDATLACCLKPTRHAFKSTLPDDWSQAHDESILAAPIPLMKATVMYFILRASGGMVRSEGFEFSNWSNWFPGI